MLENFTLNANRTWQHNLRNVAIVVILVLLATLIPASTLPSEASHTTQSRDGEYVPTGYWPLWNSLDDSPTGEVPAHTVTTLSVSWDGVSRPEGWKHVVANVSAVAPTASGSISVSPDTSTWPAVPNLSYSTGRTISNLVIAELNEAGEFHLKNTANTQIVVDVVGYYTDTNDSWAGYSYVALDPVRAFDTTATTPLAAGATASVPVPADPRYGYTEAAVAVHVTAVAPTADGTLSLFTDYDGYLFNDGPSLRFSAGRTVSTTLIVPSEVGLQVRNDSTGATGVTVDIVGHYRHSRDLSHGPTFAPVTPTRILDSGSTPVGADTTTVLQVGGLHGVPLVGATSALLNVTAQSPTGDGYATLFAGDTVQPALSTMQYTTGTTSSSLHAVRLDADGKAKLYNQGSSTVLQVDVVGYFQSDPDETAGDPPAAPPGAPINVVAQAGVYNARVTWDPPAGATAGDISGYRITPSPNPNGSYTYSSTTSATIHGLTSGVPYTFTVQAENSGGRGVSSSPSNAVTPTSFGGPTGPGTQVGPPTNVVAIPESLGATVSWTPPAGADPSSIFGYLVSPNPNTPGASTYTSDTNTYVGGLTSGQPYTFTVVALTADGSGQQSVPSNAVTPMPGSTGSTSIPQNVTAYAGDGGATVLWDPPADAASNPVLGYFVELETGEFLAYTTDPAAYIDDLDNGTTYRFRVWAETVNGPSAPSQLSNAVTPGDGPSGAGGAITGTVFEDLNESGVQDALETGAPSVQVTLTKPDWTVETTYTDPYGQYYFTSLEGGQYAIAVAPPAGYAGDSETVTVAGAPTGQTSILAISNLQLSRDVANLSLPGEVAPADSGQRRFPDQPEEAGKASQEIPNEAFDAEDAAATPQVNASEAPVETAPVPKSDGGEPPLAVFAEGESSATNYFAGSSSSASVDSPTVESVTLSEGESAYGESDACILGYKTSIAFVNGTCGIYAYVDGVLYGTDRNQISYMSGRGRLFSNLHFYDESHPSSNGHALTVGDLGTTGVSISIDSIVGHNGAAGEHVVTLTNSTSSPKNVKLVSAHNCWGDYGDDPIITAPDGTSSLPIQDDAGYGYYSPFNNEVGCYNGGNLEVIRPVSTGSRYMEGAESVVRNVLNSGADLPNTVVPTLVTDNVAALGWSGTIPANGTFEREYKNVLYSDGVGANPLPRGEDLPSVPLEQTFGLSSPCVCLRADPVNTATGAFSETFIDVSLPGTGVPFTFGRSYTSLDQGTGSLGKGWTHSYDVTLTVDGNSALLQHGDGRQVIYIKTAGVWVTPPAETSVLTEEATGYRLTETDKTVMNFDAMGQLVSWEDQHGDGLTFAYSGGRVSTVVDSGGRTTTLTYNGAHLTQVTLADGRNVKYGYTGDLLTSFENIRGEITSYSYNNAGLLTTATDPRGNHPFRNVYDSSTQRIVQQTDAGGGVTTFAWNANTQISIMTDQLGHDWTDVYDNNVLLYSTDPEGNTTNYRYDEQLNRIQTVDPNGNGTRTTYDSQNNVVAQTHADGSEESWTYNSENQPLTHTDVLGDTTSHSYDTEGRLVSSSLPSGGTVSYAYQGSLLTGFTNPLGETTTYEYDAAGNRTRSISPLGHTTELTYDASGRLRTATNPLGNMPGANPADYRTTVTYGPGDEVLTLADPRGAAISNVYDAAGNVVSTTNAEGEITTFSYDASNRQVKVAAPGSRETHTVYDLAGRITSLRTADGTTSYTYTPAGRVATVTSPKGNLAGASASTKSAYTATYEYDSAGNRISTAQPGTAETVIEYNERDWPTSVTRDPEGTSEQTFTTEYDPAGNITANIDPLGNRTERLYNVSGRSVTTKDAANRTTTTNYDLVGQVLSVVLPSGAKNTYTYNGDGQVVSNVDPRGNIPGGNPADYTTTYEYDAAGQLIQTTSPLGHGTTQSYDPAGNLISREDARGNVTSYEYDLLGRTVSVAAPVPGISPGSQSVTSYNYNSAGDLTSRTDGNQHTTDYAYDAVGRLASVVSPLGKTWNISYDAHGNRSSVETAAGTATATSGDGTVSYLYDNLDQLTGVTYSDNTPDVAYNYDILGRRASMVDGTGTTTYSYDLSNRVASIGAPNGTINYSYDSLGRRLSTEYPQGNTVSYTYTADGLLQSAATEMGMAAYGYDPAGQLTTTTLPSGTDLVETRTWDADGRLTLMENTQGGELLHRTSRTLDPNGSPLEITTETTVPNAKVRTETYAYDESNRLVSWCRDAALCSPGTTDGRTAYTYDPVGNITEEATSLCIGCAPTVRDQTHTADDELAEVLTGGDTLASFEYDENGNQTRTGPHLSAYDLNNKQTESTLWGETTAYSYNGDGVRSSKSASGQTTQWSWDTNQDIPQILAETRNADDFTLHYYGMGPIGEVSHQSDGQSFWTNDQFYLKDPMGSVVGTVDGWGYAETSVRYDPWGMATLASTSSYGVDTFTESRYTGELYDSESGQTHLRARQYSPGQHRFTGVDPVARAVGDPYVSAYSYADNQPGFYTDPKGEFVFLVALVPLGLTAADAAILAIGGTAIVATVAYTSTPQVQYATNDAITAAQDDVVLTAAQITAWQDRAAAQLAAWHTETAADAGAEGAEGAGVLTPEEEALAKGHPVDGCEIVSPYKDLTDTRKPTEGGKFTKAQKERALAANRAENGGVVTSDDPNDPHQVLVKPQKSTKGVTPPQDEWQFDHIIPIDKGGTNSIKNMRIVSREWNRFKSNK